MTANTNGDGDGHGKPRKKKLAIVGNGMAATRLIDELLERGGAARFDITVFSDESGGGYDRVLLSKVLAGAVPDAITHKPAAWYEANGVRLLEKVVVSRLDTAGRAVELADGTRHRYDVVVLATGSRPLVPPIEGMVTAAGEMKRGVFVYRTMVDCTAMRAHARAGDAAVVLGGGLLGLEAAKVLSDLGLHVTVVHASSVLMNAQLDELGGQMLEREIERCGIFVRTSRTIEAVLGEDVVEGVRLDEGKTLPADMLVLACGVRPRVEVARASGLPINKGIIVNDTLATESPGVYAIGECSEHAGKMYGLVAPAWEQAAVLADVLAGTGPQARYRGSKVYARLKVAGVDVASMGRVEPELDSDEVIQVVETRRGSYRKMIVRDGQLVGAILVGNTEAAGTLVQIFDRGDLLPDDPLEALCPNATFGGGAERDRQVCNCNRVSATRIKEAIDAGAASVEAIGAATRAGTSCGSCKTELAQILSKHAPAPKVAAAG